MSHKLLLPNKYKKLGWLMLIPASILGLILTLFDGELPEVRTWVFAILGTGIFAPDQYFTFIQTDIKNTLVGSLFIIGALLVVFSKEKNEDEFIASLRQSTLLWAVLVNYLLLLLAFVFVYGFAFFTVMVYNMFTVLIIYIARFHFVLYRNAKAMSNDKHD